MDIPSEQVICPNPQCSVFNPPHARFCGACGRALSAQKTGILPEYTAQEQNRAVSFVQPVQAVPVRLSSPTPVIPIDQLENQLSSEVPALAPQPQSDRITRKFSEPMPAIRPASPSRPSSLLKQRYQLMKKLGVGGYGVVHKAFDTEFSRMVAIKEMSQAELDGKELAAATDAFEREAMMLARLTHPNLPAILDYFSENGRWYLVMSYIEGETLEAYLNRSPGGKLPVEKVLTIGSQLASVLSYLHRRNPPIIFRDLKPSNIMRISEGQIYLIDFGIARHFKVGQIKDTIALGSPGYAAPEQYGRAQSTPQTDVYSLGATLHHMLTGIDPSDSPFNHATLDLPHYPQLSILITCMLDIDPRKRPASMGNIKRELDRISSGRSYPTGIASRGPSRRASAPQPSSQAPRVSRERSRPSFFNASVPAEYLPERQGMRQR